MTNKINWPWPQFSQRAIHRVSDLLATGRVNYRGSSVSKCFEESWCNYLKMTHCYAVCNGTQALELALESLDLEPGSEVVTPARSFIATGTSILRNQLTPIFCDVDKRTQCLNLETLKEVLSAKTKAVIVVHLGGWPAEIKTLIEYCSKNNIFVIEDCSQAHGAKIHQQMVGSFADISVFSFCVDKIISTGGEGGLVVTSNNMFADRVERLREHGSLSKLNSSVQFEYQRTIAGTNSRMTAMQMCLGLDQLEEIEEQLQRRNQIAFKIRAALESNPIFKVPQLHQHEAPSWYRIYFSIENTKPTLSERQNYYSIIKQQLQQDGIPLSNVSCPDISKEPMFSSFQNHKSRLKNCEFLANTLFCLPSHPTISDLDLKSLLKKIKKFRIKAI
jgi:dTDP-4-amino-4,6-dideoxygalactose transaminase